jgi:hypothetical protein
LRSFWDEVSDASGYCHIPLVDGRGSAADISNNSPQPPAVLPPADSASALAARDASAVPSAPKTLGGTTMPGRRLNLLPTGLESCHARNAKAGTRREVPYFLVSRAIAEALHKMRGGLVRHVRSFNGQSRNKRLGSEELLHVS